MTREAVESYRRLIRTITDWNKLADIAMHYGHDEQLTPEERNELDPITDRQDERIRPQWQAMRVNAGVHVPDIRNEAT